MAEHLSDDELNNLIDGETPLTETQEHLSACESCRTHVDHIRTSLSSLKNSQTSSPEFREQAIAAALDSFDTPDVPDNVVWFRRESVVRIFLGAAAVFFVCTIAIQTFQTKSTSEGNLNGAQAPKLQTATPALEGDSSAPNADSSVGSATAKPFNDVGAVHSLNDLSALLGARANKTSLVAAARVNPCLARLFTNLSVSQVPAAVTMTWQPGTNAAQLAYGLKVVTGTTSRVLVVAQTDCTSLAASSSTN